MNTLPRIMSKDIEKAHDVEIIDEQELWNSYTLKDGTTLKVRVALQSVKRMEKWKKDGTPIYLLNLSYISRLVDIPKTLKKKPKLSVYERT